MIPDPIRNHPESVEVTLRILRDYRVFFDEDGTLRFVVLLPAEDGAGAFEAGRCRLFSDDETAPQEPNGDFLTERLIERRRADLERDGRQPPPAEASTDA